MRRATCTSGSTVSVLVELGGNVKNVKGQMAGEMLIRIYVQTRLAPILSLAVR